MHEGYDKALQIAKILSEVYPDWETELKYKTILDLLVATVLSAQCTDERVNKVTEKLFKKYQKASDYANASLTTLEKEIKSTGFFHNKAKSLVALGKTIVSKFNGEVPLNFDDMLSLPSVGRKTANMVLANFLKRPGIAVDTHVKRLSNLIGLSNNENPDVTEQDLMKILPEYEWASFSGRLIFHGRRICKARKPDCKKCPILSYCDYGRSNKNG